MSLQTDAVPVSVLNRNTKLETKLKKFHCDFCGLGLKVTHKYSTSFIAESLSKPHATYHETALCTCMFMLVCLLAWIDLLTNSFYTENIKDDKLLSFIVFACLIHNSKPSQPTSYALHKAIQNWQYLPVACYINFRWQCDDKNCLLQSFLHS